MTVDLKFSKDAVVNVYRYNSFRMTLISAFWTTLKNKMFAGDSKYKGDSIKNVLYSANG